MARMKGPTPILRHVGNGDDVELAMPRQDEVELRKAEANLSAWWRQHKEGARDQVPVRGEAIKHLGALRKCVERTRKLDDCGAESGSSWQSPELESDIAAADRALKFLYELFGVPEVLP